MTRAKKQPKLNLVKLTPRDLRSLERGDIIHSGDGSRWKVTAVKTWVTRPKDRDYGLKYGLHSYDTLRVRGGTASAPIYKLKGESFRTKKTATGTSLKVGDRVKTKHAITNYKVGHPLYPGKTLPAGSRGVIRRIGTLTIEQARLYHGGQKALLEVKFAKDGVWYDVYPKDVTRMT